MPPLRLSAPPEPCGEPRFPKTESVESPPSVLRHAPRIAHGGSAGRISEPLQAPGHPRRFDRSGRRGKGSHNPEPCLGGLVCERTCASPKTRSHVTVERRLSLC